MIGSTFWWVERWIRRTGADAAGVVDAEAPREPAYYLDRVIRRVERLEALMRQRG